VRLYTAHLREGRPPVLVREGFCWGAALFGPLWLGLHRAWIACILALVAGIVLLFIGQGVTTLVLWLCFAWLLGLLGHDLWRWGLERRRYELSHVVVAPSTEAALVRLLSERPDLRSMILADLP